MSEIPLVCTVLARPEHVRALERIQWQLLLSQAYAGRLLGRLYAILIDRDLFQHVPKPLQWHFHSAYELSLSHARDMRIEVHQVENALKMAGIVPTFLKGVAYDLAGDRTARGRLYGDVDIYIPAAQLPAAERVLGLRGWRQGEMTEYDQSYYRRWMHEIPPLVNAERGITLDVHHSLLPLTCRYAFSADQLKIEQTAEGHSILSTTDRILHAICHLFMESEFDHGLRDLSDLDLLLRQYSVDNSRFWQDLLDRAEELGVGCLCFYALRYCLRIFETPIPEEVLNSSNKRWAPNALQLALLDPLFERVLTTQTAADESASTRLAHFMLYLRGHWLRMPLRLLLPHLFRKAIMGLRPVDQATEETLTR